MSTSLLFDPSEFTTPSSCVAVAKAPPRRRCRVDGPTLFDSPLSYSARAWSLAELLSAKRRVRRCPSRYLYVRRVKGGWQARVPVGPTTADSVNLGYFPDSEYGGRDEAEWKAGHAAKMFSRLRVPGRTCWDVVRLLQERGDVPERVLPRWVFLRPDGGYGAKRRSRAGDVVLPGPYPTPEAAFAAIVARLGRRVVA